MASTFDHRGNLERRLPRRLADAVNFLTWMGVLIDAVQRIDDVRAAIARERDLDVARGVNLDMLGRTLFYARIHNWPDATYRFVLKVIQTVRRSSGVLGDVLNVATKLQSNSDLPVQVIPVYPKGLVVQMANVDPLLKGLVVQFLLDTVTATTGLDVINYIEGEYFGFLEDPDALGFNLGQLAEILEP